MTISMRPGKDPQNAQPVDPQTLNFVDNTPHFTQNDDLDIVRRRFYEALLKAYQGDLNENVLRNTTLFDNLARHYNIEDINTKPDGSPIGFQHRNTGHIFLVTKDVISFVDNDDKFTFADAMEMAKFAALDKTMQQEGVTLEGNKKQRVLLQRAIAEVNRSLPRNQRIKIHNKDGGKVSNALSGITREVNEFRKNNETDFKLKKGQTVDIPTATVPSGSGNNGSGANGSSNNLSEEAKEAYVGLTEPIQAEGKPMDEIIRDFLDAGNDVNDVNAPVDTALTDAKAAENFIEAVPHGQHERPQVTLDTNFSDVVSNSSGASAPTPTAPVTGKRRQEPKPGGGAVT